MDFIINEQLAQKILNYLALKPYGEVAPLIAELMQLKKVEAPKE
jgi:hypothetical protein